MSNSARMKSNNWLEFIRELNSNAVFVRRRCSQSSSRFTRVVFPVPTSPVNVMNPLRVCMPYINPESASSICFVRNRYRGSGLTLNGFSFSPKKLLYMIVWSSPRPFPSIRLGALLRQCPFPFPFLRQLLLRLLRQYLFLRQYQWPRVPVHAERQLVCREVRRAICHHASPDICSLDIRGVAQ